MTQTFAMGQEVLMSVRRRRRRTGTFYSRVLVTIVDVVYHLPERGGDPVNYYIVSLGYGGTLCAGPSELRPGTALDRIVSALEDCGPL